MKGITFIAVAVVVLAIVAGGLVLALGSGGTVQAETITQLQKEIVALRTQVEQLYEANEHLEGELKQQQRVVTALLNRVKPDTEFALAMHITGFEGMGDHLAGRNPRLEVRQGDLVRLSLTNGEAVEHDWVIDGVAHSPHLEEMGDTATVIFLAEKAGEFTYYCSVPGHRQAGMEGVLVVKAGPGGYMETAEAGHKD